MRVQGIKPVQRLGPGADERLPHQKYLLKNWEPYVNWSEGKDHHKMGSFLLIVKGASLPDRQSRLCERGGGKAIRQVDGPS